MYLKYLVSRAPFWDKCFFELCFQLKPSFVFLGFWQWPFLCRCCVTKWTKYRGRRPSNSVSDEQTVLSEHKNMTKRSADQVNNWLVQNLIIERGSEICIDLNDFEWVTKFTDLNDKEQRWADSPESNQDFMGVDFLEETTGSISSMERKMDVFLPAT